MDKSTCCFFGHRTIAVTEKLKKQLCEIVEQLIVEEKVDTFLFGSRSCFDSLCLATVTKVKEKYPYIKRVYVRAEFPLISDSYKAYLLELYDDTYYPERIGRAGRAVYIERNCEMIDKSRFCIVYYDKDYTAKKSKSGTDIAIGYALKQKKRIINTACENAEKSNFAKFDFD